MLKMLNRAAHVRPSDEEFKHWVNSVVSRACDKLLAAATDPKLFYPMEKIKGAVKAEAEVFFEKLLQESWGNQAAVVDSLQAFNSNQSKGGGDSVQASNLNQSTGGGDNLQESNLNQSTGGDNVQSYNLNQSTGGDSLQESSTDLSKSCVGQTTSGLSGTSYLSGTSQQSSTVGLLSSTQPLNFFLLPSVQSLPSAVPSTCHPQALTTVFLNTSALGTEQRQRQISVIKPLWQAVAPHNKMDNPAETLPPSYPPNNVSNNPQSINHQAGSFDTGILRKAECPVEDCGAVYVGEFRLSLLQHHLALAHCKLIMNPGVDNNNKARRMGSQKKTSIRSLTWFDRYCEAPSVVDNPIGRLLIGLLSRDRKTVQCPFCFLLLENGNNFVRNVSAFR
jgi:hypothetical protein